ncbi:hypothetical protein Q3H58_000148 [Pseudomonas psychrotolerans]|nr:hypothetical protein [Pseudomonas psychrotolerans]
MRSSWGTACSARALADIDAIGIAPAHVEDGRGDQPVIEHHVSLLHQAQRTEGQQIRIAWAGTDQVDLTTEGFPFIRQLGFQQLLGDLGLAGEHLLGDLTLEHLFPKDAPRLDVGEARLDPGTEALRQLRQLTIGRRNPTLQLGAHQARQYRSIAAAGNGDHQRRAVDDGRKYNGTELGRVHGIDRQTQSLGIVGHRLVDHVIVGGGDHQAVPGKQVGRIALYQASAALRLDEGADLRLDLRCDQGDAGTGLGQEHALAQGDIAPADHQHRTAVEFVKERQVVHQPMTSMPPI